MEDRYFDHSQCINRLKRELDKYGSLYIAFDFDNTVFDFHNQGDTFPEIETILRKAKDLGHRLILFTAKGYGTKELGDAIEYCKEKGFKPDHINWSPIIKGNSPKPYYNILLDDRAGLQQAFVQLEVILDYQMDKNEHN